MTNGLGLLRVFVYGTLKSGQHNFVEYCSGFVACEKATLAGRLYLHPSGFPILQIPPTNVLATGTNDPLADLVTQQRIASELPTQTDMSVRPGGEWAAVRGELFTFRDAFERLPKLDGLEDFHPREKSMYDRVLTVIDSGSRSVAWVYIMPLHRSSGFYEPCPDPGYWPGTEIVAGK